MDLPGVEEDVTNKHRCFTNRRRLSKDEIAEGIRLVDDMWYERPKTRGECFQLPRPCPFVGCRYHLMLDPTGKGETSNLSSNRPDRDPTTMGVTCALDVADEGWHTLERIGEILNVTRERVRQIEERALRKLRRAFYLAHEQPLKDALVLWDAIEEWRAMREPFDEWVYFDEA